MVDSPIADSTISFRERNTHYTQIQHNKTELPRIEIA